MPMPGDQHCDTPATTNPFLEQKRQMATYTAAEIATLQARLDKQLGPEYVSSRPGAGGGKVHYLAAEKAINLANEVFGFNGWSSSIQNVQIDFVDESRDSGKISLGLSTIVRVTIRDGTFHEDIGYGHIENCKGKAAAFEKAKKEAATDALKRALRNFGNVLGNCLYDKDYLAKVQKIKVQPSRWDDKNLHRHPDYAPVKQDAQVARREEAGSGPQRHMSLQSGVSYDSAEFEDDFGGNMLDETDFSHPDEVRLDDSAMQTPGKMAAPAQQPGQQRQGVPRMQSMPQLRPPNIQNQPPVHSSNAPQRQQGLPKPLNNAIQPPAQRLAPPPLPQAHQTASNGPSPQQARFNQTDTAAGTTNQSFDSPGAAAPPQNPNSGGTSPPHMPPPGHPEGFVSGKSAGLLNDSADARTVATFQPFNPNAEATSIRRTAGVNPGKSAPVARQSLQQQQQASRAGIGNPAGDHAPPPFQQHSAFPPQRAQSPAQATNGFQPGRTNFVDPSTDTNRRIGMPNLGPGLQNRGQYRPPTAVNGGQTGGVKRPPLSDVSNIQQTDGAGDAKRPKLNDTVERASGDAAQQATT